MLNNILIALLILFPIVLLLLALYIKLRHAPIIELEIENAKFDEVFPAITVDKKQEIKRVELKL